MMFEHSHLYSFHTLDSYFGIFPKAGGVTTSIMSDGSVIPVAEATDTYHNIAHTSDGAATAWDGNRT